jgi:hypothetical protein
MSIEMPMALETPSADAPERLQQDDGQAQSPTADTAVLITKDEVSLGTAAAAGLRKKNRRWFGAPGRIFAMAVNDSRPRTQHIQRRIAYLEDARIAREMERL